jgi:hypothetical protein
MFAFDDSPFLMNGEHGTFGAVLFSLAIFVGFVGFGFLLVWFMGRRKE